MLQLTTPEKLALFQTTKEERKAFVEDLINALNEGELNPLDIHLQVKAMEDIITQLTATSRYKHLLLECVQQHSSKSFDYHSAKFEIREAGVKYDYSQCNDPEYSELIEKKKLLDEKVKAREKFLQTVPLSGIEILFNDELIRVYPPSKKSTTSVSVTFK